MERMTMTIAAAVLCLGAGARVTALEAGADLRGFVDSHGCIGCHGLDETRIGPPYRAIAGRYRNAGAPTIEILAQKIIHGGAGNWGIVPMVANPQVTPDEARAVVRWILDQPPPD